MPELLIEVDGKTMPLKDCGWLQREQCGCVVAALLAVPAEGMAYATAEQAHRQLRPNKRSRNKDDREGRRMELISMDHYRTNVGANWECDKHQKVVTR